MNATRKDNIVTLDGLLLLGTLFLLQWIHTGPTSLMTQMSLWLAMGIILGLAIKRKRIGWHQPPRLLLLFSAITLFWLMIQTLPLPAGILAWVTPLSAQALQTLHTYGLTEGQWHSLALDRIQVWRQGLIVGESLWCFLLFSAQPRLSKHAMAFVVLAFTSVNTGLFLAFHYEKLSAFWGLPLQDHLGIGNPNQLASLLVSMLTLILFSAVHWNNVRQKDQGIKGEQAIRRIVLLIPASLLIIITLFNLHSRAGLILLLLALGLLAIKWLSQGQKTWMVGLAGVLVLLASGLLYFQQRSALGNEVAAIAKFQHYGLNAGARLQLFRQGLATIREHSLLGTGLGATPLFLSKQVPRGKGTGRLTHFHNDYLELISETGLLGWALLAALFWFLWQTGRRFFLRKGHWYDAGLWAAALILLTHSLISFPLRISVIRLFFIFLLAQLWRRWQTYRRLDQQLPMAHRSPRHSPRVAGALLAAWGLLGLCLAVEVTQRLPLMGDSLPTVRRTAWYGDTFQAPFYQALEQIRLSLNRPMEPDRDTLLQAKNSLLNAIGANPHHLEAKVTLLTVDHLLDQPAQTRENLDRFLQQLTTVDPQAHPEHFSLRQGLLFGFMYYDPILNEAEKARRDELLSTQRNEFRQLKKTVEHNSNPYPT